MLCLDMIALFVLQDGSEMSPTVILALMRLLAIIPISFHLDRTQQRKTYTRMAVAVSDGTSVMKVVYFKNDHENSYPDDLALTLD